MEADAYINMEAANGNTVRRALHAHDSGDEDDTMLDENSETSLSMGHVTHASRRAVAVQRVNSSEGDGVRHRSSPHHKTRKGSRGRPSQQPSSSKQQHKKGSLRHNGSGNLRLCVGIGGVVYLLLMIKLLYHPGLPPFSPSEFNISMRPSPQHQPTKFERERQDEVRRQARQRAETATKERAVLRRQHSRPPIAENHVLEQATSRYEFYLADDERRVRSNKASTGQKSTPARLEDLCGALARNASLAHPNSFLASDALDHKARVMVTGVLNPVGFRLALTLKEKCGVEVITGIDPCYPNTVQHRLTLLERMQILATSIPRMIQPIVQPLIGLNPKMNKKRPSNKQPFLLHSTGEVNLLSFRPTHIIHLASYTEDEYRDETAQKEGRINVNSPYTSDGQIPPLYYLRSSMVSMEHILASIASEDKVKSRPHFTYASSMGVASSSSDLQSRIKLVDELLADSYRSMRGVASVGLRFPGAVYGPWGRPGTPEYQLADAALRNWNDVEPYDALLESAGLADVAQEDRDFLFVDDVVDAIIAAMQYRPESPSSPTMFNLGSESVASLSTAAQIMEHMKPVKSRDQKPVLEEKASDSTALLQPTREYLKWSPTTRFQDGIMKLLAWHLDRAIPYGPPPMKPKHAKDAVASMTLPDETGDVFLSRNDAAVCSAEDALCHSGKPALPCVSECSTKLNCASSVFDSVVDVIKEVTEGCDIIMYTQSLGYDVEDLGLEAQYVEEGKRIVCNFAFIPQESKLVKTVTKKVPNSQLEKFGITVKADNDDWENTKIEGLNGRLLYKGWILVWLKDAMAPLSSADESLLKMNPGKFFAPCVTHAMFVAENFPVTPNVQDVLFLVDEMKRSPLKERSVYRNEHDGKKHKYVLDAEPQRQAIMLTAPLKHILGKRLVDNKERISVIEATKFMTSEIGRDPFQHESPLVRKQREFYERISSFINRVDMRSPFERLYKYGLKHYIRSRWMVHDLKAEQGRQLRCDWYQEHLRWGTDIDQLSFAYVMQTRELARRVANREPDDRVKVEDHPELKELTDMHEWHPLLDPSKILASSDEEEKADKEAPDEHDGPPTMQVRTLKRKHC